MLRERPPQLDAHLAVVRLAGLPPREADLLDDRIDVGDDLFDDDRYVGRRVLTENLGEGAELRVGKERERTQYISTRAHRCDTCDR